MLQQMSRRVLAAGLVVLVLGFCGGCDIVIVPPEASVLEGTWDVTTDDDTGVTQTSFTFNALGDLTKVVYRIGDAITVTDNRPNATTTVDGDDVTISTTFGGNGLVIEGTLNAERTVITGTQNARWHLGGVTINIDNGDVTLTKQP